MPRKRRPPRPGALADLAPLRILRKMLLLQAAYYGVAAVLLTFSVLVAGRRPELDLLLGWRTLRADTTVGWMLALVWLLTSLTSVIAILVVVVRSKLVPDFALTVLFIHLVLTSLYSHSIPYSLFWWGVQGASAAIMTILGVWSCQWRELRPISFGFGGLVPPNGAAPENGALVQPSSSSHDGEEGFEMVARGEP